MRKGMDKRQRRGKRLKACGVAGKTVYGSEKQARRQAAKSSARLGEQITAYCCRHCERWHIGHAYNDDRDVVNIAGIGRVVVKHFA